MKYIKDRFYNSRKRSPSLGTPNLDLFTREERFAFSCGLWAQRYNKFLKPPNIRRSFFFESSIGIRKSIENSEAAERRNPSKLPVVRLSRNRVRHLWPAGSPSSLGNPSLLSCECKGTTTFRIHQIFGEVFFFREPHSGVLHLLYYIGAPKSQWHPLHNKSPSISLSIKTCSPLKDLQTPPKTRSFELRVQRYNDFLKPPNFQQTFFFAPHIPPAS